MNSNIRQNFFFKCGIPLIALILAAVHAYSDEITIDQTTIWLLVIAAVPLLASYLNTFKFGDLELDFKSLNQEDQIIVFLKSLAQNALPTFYDPREDHEETELGQVGKHLVSEIKRKNPARLYEEIDLWLHSKERGLRWFASEIIGYFELKQFSTELKAAYNTNETTQDWENWKLNYLWAHSKLENSYQELDEFLRETTSVHNQNWLFDVYYQMAKSKPNLKKEFLKKCEDLQAKASLPPASNVNLQKTIDAIKSIK